MSLALAKFTERLVPISDFSQGKAGKIFSDVYENDNEYIVLKNNQPTAVVISVNQYKETQRRIERLEKMLEELIGLEDVQEETVFSPMTEEDMYAKLEKSREHVRAGKYKEAGNMVAEMRAKYGL